MSDLIRPSLDGLSRRLAEFTHDFRLEQAPRSVVNNAKLAILDCLGVSMLAATQEIGDCLRKFARVNVATGLTTQGQGHQPSPSPKTPALPAAPRLKPSS